MSESEPLLIQHVYQGNEWLAQAREDIIEPELPIIDPHHHFSEHWGGYFGENLLDDLESGHNVVATVYIQCGYGYRNSGPEALRPVGETEQIVAIAQGTQSRNKNIAVAAGIVGYADLALGEGVDEVLAAQIQAGQSRLRGIRCAGARHDAIRHGVLPLPAAGLFKDKAFRTGYALLAKYGLSFESWTYHHQLDDVVDLARAFPHIPVIVNHIGGTLGVGPFEGKRQEVIDDWLPKIKRLAVCPNVSMKLGGLGTAVFGFRYSERNRPPSSEEVAKAWGPYFKTCIDLFGTQRCMFESNYPVDRAATSYQVLWNAFKRIAADASSHEKAAMFHDNAARIYRLPLTPIQPYPQG